MRTRYSTLSCTRYPKIESFRTIRAALKAFAEPNDAVGYTIAGSLVITYVASLAGFCIVDSWFRWVLLAVASFLVGMLFIVGHDACHMSLVSLPFANRLIGYISFAPTLHPFAAWEIGHNRRHHAFTNLRSVDYVWRPWSAEEFMAASMGARLLYRLYHSPLGIGLYYPIEIWLKHMWFGDAHDRRNIDFKRVHVDRARAAFGFTSILLFCAALLAARGYPPGIVATNVLLAVLAPLTVYFYLMSVVIFIHHRHPHVVWFDEIAGYDPITAQIEGTVHAEGPRFLEIAFLDILQHTAHHAEDRVPFYYLRDAQDALRAQFSSRVLSVPLTLRSFLRILSECQLYDYDRRHWLRFRDARAQAPGSGSGG